MTTVADLIQQAFLDLAVVQPGESISATMQTSAFAYFLQMYSGWNAEALMAWEIVNIPFTPTPGLNVYTLGVGGGINTGAFTRPVRVMNWRANCGFFQTSGQIASMAEYWQKAQNRTGAVSLLPEIIATDTSYPLINVYLFPFPVAPPGALPAPQIQLQFWAAVTFTSLTDSMDNLPDAFQQALHYNLAIALSPQYSRVGGVTPELAANAQNSKAVIVQKNAEIWGYGQNAPQQPGA